MRISDWSSDVCSSDLRDLLVDLGGFFLGLAGGLRAHLDVLDDAKLLVLALDDLHARLETLVRALGEGLVRLLDSLVNHALAIRSEEHTSELPSLMRNSYSVFCLKKKKTPTIPE